MLFHVTHTHDYQTCMVHREEAKNEFNDGFTKATAANKVKILSTYNNRGHHTRIWILEKSPAMAKKWSSTVSRKGLAHG